MLLPAPVPAPMTTYELPPVRKCASEPSACSSLSARSFICEVMYLEFESSGEAESVAIQYLFQMALRSAVSLLDLKYEISSW